MGLLKAAKVYLRVLNRDYKVGTIAPWAECVLAQSFGFRQEGDKVLPGLSNQQLAATLAEHYRDVPKILQFEVADAYAELVPGDPKVIRIEEHRQSDKYLDTREVLAQAAILAREAGYKKVALLAFKWHAPRVLACGRRLGLVCAAVAPAGEPRFDPRSEQAWTRNLGAWRRREAMVCSLYGLKGWI